MGVLRKKDERTETITVRIPSSVKAELDQLRERSDAAGFDLNHHVRIHDSIGQASTRGTGRRCDRAQSQQGRGPAHANGLTRVGGEHFPAASGSGGKGN